MSGFPTKKDTPFCTECPHVVDFGPYEMTKLGLLPTKVKHIEGKMACVNCPHRATRQALFQDVKVA